VVAFAAVRFREWSVGPREAGMHLAPPGGPSPVQKADPIRDCQRPKESVVYHAPGVVPGLEMIVARDPALRNVSNSMMLDLKQHESEAPPGAHSAGARRYGRLVAQTQPMLELFAQLRRLERSLTTVLIEGESGTGKELVALALHERSSVASGPFIAVNCGALDSALVRSELFGHRKGAFTSASRAHQGAFEAACGGTLFLDEIGELAPEVQPILLRTIETRTVSRIGETLARPIHVRLIAATNRDLAEEVHARRFRDDLFYRLAVVRLRVPALRERRADIALLAQDIATHLNLGHLAPTLVRDLAARSWPGNVRELRNAIQAHAALGVLPPPLLGQTRAADPESLASFVDPTRPYAEQKEKLMQHFQSLYFQQVLALSKGNKSAAARLAGVERSYLTRVVRSFAQTKF
jgi:two-component system, NtrC family, response regulator GlrR